MLIIIISFLTALVATTLIVHFSHGRQALLDHDLSGVQKIHARAVPRVGGIGIFVAAMVACAVAWWREPSVGRWIALLLVPAAVAFGGGLIDDFTKRFSATWRLLLTLISAAIGYFLLDAVITRIDVPLVDGWLKYAWISLPLTVLAVAGIVNAVNLIDGFNGLASVVAMFTLLSLAYVAFQVRDVYVLTAALIMVGAIAGFLLWNYPNGLIFLGDGGAYLIGFMMAELAVLLVARNPQVSPWYAALLMIYPMFETVFSIYRRKFVRGVATGMPDGVHLHMLIFKRLVRWTIGRHDARDLARQNSLTSPYLWLLSLMAVIPATLLWWHTTILIGFCSAFVMSYVWLYLRIVRFRVPKWMILGRKGGVRK